MKQTKFVNTREHVLARRDAETLKVVERVDRVITKPDVKTKNWETEAPSSEIVFKKNFKGRGRTY